MLQVKDLPEDLRRRLGTRDVVVFDGICGLCSGFARFILRIDRAERFHFVRAQSNLGQALYRALGLPTEAFETNLIIVDGVIYTKLDSLAAAFRAVGGAWRALAVIRWLPLPLKDALYDPIARNRYRIFGRTDICMRPDAPLLGRCLDRI